MLRWLGSILAWCAAPFAGIAAINLPLFVFFLVDKRYAATLGQHAPWALGAAALLAAWVALVWAVARAHTPAARRVHLILACVLALGGVALVYRPGHTSGDAAVTKIL